MVAPRSLDAIARETTLLLKNKERMRLMGRLAKERVERFFTVGSQAKKIEGILDEIFNR